MAPLTKSAQSQAIHSLNIGRNGSAKTGALAALVFAGYKLRILAFEAGTEILINLLREAGWSDEKIDEHVDIELCIDQYHMFKAGKVNQMRCKKAAALPKAINAMASWPGYGSPTTWKDDTIFVMDTMTSQGRACMNFTFDMKGKLTSLDADANKITQPDWGDAMRLQEDMMAQIMMLPCHVIVNAHIAFVTPDGETADQGFPSALGSKLPPKIGGYFNHILHFTNRGIGLAKTRGFTPKSTGLIETKTSAPGIVSDWYPLNEKEPLKNGLAKYFSDIRGPLKPAA